MMMIIIMMMLPVHEPSNHDVWKQCCMGLMMVLFIDSNLCMSQLMVLCVNGGPKSNDGAMCKKLCMS